MCSLASRVNTARVGLPRGPLDKVELIPLGGGSDDHCDNSSISCLVRMLEPESSRRFYVFHFWKVLLHTHLTSLYKGHIAPSIEIYNFYVNTSTPQAALNIALGKKIFSRSIFLGPYWRIRTAENFVCRVDNL